MPRLLKTLDQDLAFKEDLQFDAGFVLELLDVTKMHTQIASADFAGRIARLGVDELVRRYEEYESSKALRGGVLDADLRREAAALLRKATAIKVRIQSIERLNQDVRIFVEHCYRHVANALVEMSQIVRDRLALVASRSDAQKAPDLVTAWGTLVGVEQILKAWRDKFPTDVEVEDALSRTTAWIDAVDDAMAVYTVRTGSPSLVGLRQIVSGEGLLAPTTPPSALSDA